MARLNENENENESTGGNRDGLFAGGRYNTYKILKQAFDANRDLFVAPSSGRYPQYEELAGWDAENKGWIYVRDFITLKPSWFEELKRIANDTWKGWDPTEAGKGTLTKALQEIIDAAGEREDRFAEAFHQQDAEGCISYWMAMLRIDPAKQPNSYQLIRVARKIGEMIVMCLKEDIHALRPSQICPAIIPMFDPPRTASYPAGHSLQSYLKSYLLMRVMPKIQQSKPPQTWEQVHEGLFALARRVADNRVIAGVHFDIDSKAGFLIAQEIDKWFDVWLGASGPAGAKTFRELIDGARKEFPQFN